MNKPTLDSTKEALIANRNYYHKTGKKNLMYAANCCIGLICNGQKESDHFKYYYSFLEKEL